MSQGVGKTDEITPVKYYSFSYIFFFFPISHHPPHTNAKKVGSGKDRRRVPIHLVADRVVGGAMYLGYKNFFIVKYINCIPYTLH